MKNLDRRFAALWACSLLALGCEQQKVNFSGVDGGEGNFGGECGPWYAEGDADAGTASPFAIEEGAVFPCLVWEFARINHEDTWINVGELYLGFKHGELVARAMVIVYTGVNCSGCRELVQNIAAKKSDFDKAAFMIGLSRDIFAAESQLSLDEVEEVLVEQDSWPTQWAIINDSERHLPEADYNGVPWIVVVRLRDMRVMVRSNSTFSKANVDELLDFVENL